MNFLSSGTLSLECDENAHLCVTEIGQWTLNSFLSFLSSLALPSNRETLHQRLAIGPTCKFLSLIPMITPETHNASVLLTNSSSK